jgi:hypothetical protein
MLLVLLYKWYELQSILSTLLVQMLQSRVVLAFYGVVFGLAAVAAVLMSDTSDHEHNIPKSKLTANWAHLMERIRTPGLDSAM